MLKIGLTGGIGSGKSTVAKCFSDYNTPIIDADIIAHQLVKPGKPALSLIKKEFGKQIINNDASLNRKKLQKIIFTDSDKKKQLEEMLHPLIYEQMQTEFDKQSSAYCILCIPLLMETNKTDFVNRILVVDCPVENQIERVKQRDKLLTGHILSIISSQVSRKYRLSQADDVIENLDSSDRLAEQVKSLHNQYLLISNP